jgi:hypothetical protein
MGNVAWLSDDTEASNKVGAVAADLERLLREPVAGRNSGQGSWLDGLKVLDLTTVIAGPTIASTLIRFEANVTALQPVDPSVDPWNAVIFGLQGATGQGKRAR